MTLKEKICWSCSGVVLSLLLALIIGGVYAITPPSGPVDAAYKINRFTGKVWLIKIYTKNVGSVRALAARQAEVEKTMAFTAAVVSPVAMAGGVQRPRATRSR